MAPTAIDYGHDDDTVSKRRSPSIRQRERRGPPLISRRRLYRVKDSRAAEAPRISRKLAAADE